MRICFLAVARISFTKDNIILIYFDLSYVLETVYMYGAIGRHVSCSSSRNIDRIKKCCINEHRALCGELDFVFRQIAGIRFFDKF